jgi:hypothetical protein
MSESRIGEYLHQMRIAADDATDFVGGMDKASFLGDRRTQQAVVMSLVILGEAATRIMDRYPDFAAARPEDCLAIDAWYVQPDRARLFRDRFRRGLGNGANRAAGTENPTGWHRA